MFNLHICCLYMNSDNQQTPDYLKCPYGKYFKDIGQQPTCNPFGQSCPPGYYCGAGPADQPGFCCKSKKKITFWITWLVFHFCFWKWKCLDMNMYPSCGSWKQFVSFLVLFLFLQEWVWWKTYFNFKNV